MQIEPSPVETQAYRVRKGCAVHQNGVRHGEGAVIQLSALQAADRTIAGHVELAPAAAPSPAPPAPRPAPAPEE